MAAFVRAGPATDLADLAGMLAAEKAHRVCAGDPRHQRIIADEILREAGCPDLGASIERLASMLRQRRLRKTCAGD
ncbi:MAG TPA: hypothetical protein VFA12_20350 [Stellaceae bacterium]|nr:hypothetical protein [Stellaceae bacterium]